MKQIRWTVGFRNSLLAVGVLTVAACSYLVHCFAQDLRATGEVTAPEETVVSDLPAEGGSEVVTISVRNGSISDVLNAFSRQTGRSIVIGPEVSGPVTLRLSQVPWEEALDVILKPYGYGHKMVGETIVVNKLEKLAEVEQVEPIVSKVFRLRFLDAADVREMVEAHLSPRGSMSSLAVRGQVGWVFETGSGGGTGTDSGVTMGKRQRVREEIEPRSKTLVVADIPSVVKRIEDMLSEVDQMPMQVMIESKFMEVNTGVLSDIGLEFGTGPNGARTADVMPVNVRGGGNVFGLGVQQTGGSVEPAAFSPDSADLSGTRPFNAGLSLLFQQLSSTQFEVLLHLLEEEGSMNILSAPRIMTLNDQEAAIVVGTKFPIIRSEVSGEGAGTTSTSIDYWQDIGIQLNVVPQVCDDELIRMIVHPAVTAQIGTVSGRTLSGSSAEGLAQGTEYPILSTRETETQIVVRNGDTIAIGGLLKDEESITEFKVPVLGDLPLLGYLFRRRTVNNRKMDLVIFLTATITPPSELAQAAPGGPEAGSQVEPLHE